MTNRLFFKNKKQGKQQISKNIHYYIFFKSYTTNRGQEFKRSSRQKQRSSSYERGKGKKVLKIYVKQMCY